MTTEFTYPTAIRVPLDALIGIVAGFTVAPFITVVDKAVVQSSSG